MSILAFCLDHRLPFLFTKKMVVTDMVFNIAKKYFPHIVPIYYSDEVTENQKLMVHFDSTVDKKSILWALDNIKNPWYFIVSPIVDIQIEFYFSNENDAVIFKTFWG